MDEERLDLGPCCYCNQAPAVVVAMLDFKIPAEHRGHLEGWGCVICKLPTEGAISVFCEGCSDLLGRSEERLAAFAKNPTIRISKDQVVMVCAEGQEPHAHNPPCNIDARLN